MSEQESLDTFYQTACPTVPVPIYGKLPAMAASGKRLLVAADGLYLEIKRPWLSAIAKLSDIPTAICVPYGRVTPKIELLCGQPPIEFLQRFLQQCQDDFPNETAAWITWSAATRQFCYIVPEITLATPTRVKINCPELDENESLVLDLHSHGLGSAYFSDEDDADDAQGGVRISGVLGRVHSNAPEAVFRLHLGGIYLPVNLAANCLL